MTHSAMAAAVRRDAAHCALGALLCWQRAAAVIAREAAMLEEAKTKIGAEGAVFPGCATVVDRDQH